MPAFRTGGWRLAEGVEPSAEHRAQNESITRFMDTMAQTGERYCGEYETHAETLDGMLAVPLSAPKQVVTGNVYINFSVMADMTDDNQRMRNDLRQIQAGRNWDNGVVPMEERELTIGERAMKYLKERGFEIVGQTLYDYSFDTAGRRASRRNAIFRANGDERSVRF